jgi:hypothetical protein
MAERDQHSDFGQEFQLPYQPGEFDDVANRLTRLVASLEQRHVTGLVPEELRFAAAALRRAETLLSPTTPAEPMPELSAEAPVALPMPVEPEPQAEASEGSARLEVGQRGEWRGHVGRQPEFERLQNGRTRAVFYLAQHNDPTDPEKTEWLRCYNLDRYAEALRKKGRLAGADVLVRGAFQGERTVTRKNRPPQQQKTIYCYGIRVLKPAANDRAQNSPGSN